jgi:hypothetical protein
MIVSLFEPDTVMETFLFNLCIVRLFQNCNYTLLVGWSYLLSPAPDFQGNVHDIIENFDLELLMYREQSHTKLHVTQTQILTCLNSFGNIFLLTESIKAYL